MASMRKVNGNYYARFYDRTRSPKRKTYPLRTSRKDVARRRLTELEKRWEKGEFDPWNPDDDAPEHATVKQTISRYVSAKSHLREATLKEYRVTLNAWHRDHCPAGLNLRDLQPKHLRPYVHAAADIEQATRGKRYRYLRAFCNWCVDSGLLGESPLEGVRKPEREKKKQAFLSPEDVEKILRCVDAHAELRRGQGGPPPDDQWLKALIRVGVCTGLRRAELLRLRFEDIDLANRVLYVRNRGKDRTKSGHERAVPLAGDAFDVLQRLSTERADDQTRVFTDSKGRAIKPTRASKRFKFFVRKARLRDRERLKLHSLRHTCGSWLAMRGVPMQVIRDILGHSSTQITERYSHVAPEVAVKAMQETFG